MRRQGRRHRIVDVLAAERAPEGRVERHDVTVDAQGRRSAGNEQQVAGRLFDDLLEPRAQPRGLIVGTPRARRAGVQLRDERIEIVGLGHFRSGAFRNRVRGVTCLKTVRRVP